MDTLTRNGERYVVTAGAKTYEADNVVVATGVMQKPVVPTFAPELDPSITQLHSSDYRNLSQLQTKGLSWWSARATRAPTSPTRQLPSTRRSCREETRARFLRRSRPGAGELGQRVLFFVGSHVLTMDTPLGRKMRPHVRHGGAPLLRYRKKDLRAAGVERVFARTVGVQDGLPVLDDGRVLDVRNVVWCTGFRPDYTWIKIPLEQDEDGYPVQYRGAVDSAPGLYFVGMLFLHSFTSMLIVGASKDAERVAEHLVARSSEERAQASSKAPVAALAEKRAAS